jgi:hypothetical protein
MFKGVAHLSFLGVFQKELPPINAMIKTIAMIFLLYIKLSGYAKISQV